MIRPPWPAFHKLDSERDQTFADAVNVYHWVDSCSHSLPIAQLFRQATKMLRTTALATFTVTLAALLAGCGLLKPHATSLAEVEYAHGKLADAFSTCDESAFADAYADDFSFVTSNTRSTIRTRDGLRGYLAASCRSRPNPTASITSQSVRFLDTQAIVTGQYLFRVPSGGKILDVPQNFTVVFLRQGETWKIAAHHVSLAP